jgi:hypothetical protein
MFNTLPPFRGTDNTFYKTQHLQTQCLRSYASLELVIHTLYYVAWPNRDTDTKGGYWPEFRRLPVP